MAMQHSGGRFIVAYNEAADVGVTEFRGRMVPFTAGPSRFRPAVSIDGAFRYQVVYESVPPGLTDGFGSGIFRRRGSLL